MTHEDDNATELNQAKTKALEVVNQLAYRYFQSGSSAIAIRTYCASIMIENKQSEVHANLCALYRRSGQLDLAIRHGKASVSQNPNNAPALNNLGLAFQESKELEDACNCFRNALKLQPKNLGIVCNLAGVLAQQGVFNQSLALLESYLVDDPNHEGLLRRYGITLFHADEYSKAKSIMEKLVKLHVDRVVDWGNLGKVNKELGLFEEAAAAYQKALKIAPEDPNVQWNLGILELLQGNFKSGFKRYEFGWAAKQRNPLRQFSKPIWLGQGNLVGKKILITAEQGYGDNILCVRFLKDLVQLGANEVLVEATQPLRRLFEAIPGDHRVVDAGYASDAYDFYCPIMSLPLALNLTTATLKTFAPYVYPRHQDIDQYDHVFVTKKLRVGVAWRGRESPKGRQVDLALLGDLFNLDAHFFVLQKDLTKSECEILELKNNVCRLDDHLSDFYETACIIKKMDVVISVDTAVAHLAGALNVKTLLMLKKIPDWRWLMNTDRSIWFPALQLIRQKSHNDWSEVIKEVSSRIKSMIIQSRPDGVHGS